MFQFPGHVRVFPGSGPLHVPYPLAAVIFSTLQLPGFVRSQHHSFSGRCASLFRLMKDSLDVLTHSVLFFAFKVLIIDLLQASLFQSCTVAD